MRNLKSSLLFAVCWLIICPPGRNMLAQQPASEVLKIPVNRDNQIVAGPELNAAQENFLSATDSHSTMQRLADRGAISKSRLSRAVLKLRIAELELDSLNVLENSRKNRIEIASVQLQFVRQQFEISSRLFAKGAVSKVQHRRKAYSYKYAQLVYQALIGDISNDAAKLVIARLKAKLAGLEFELAEKLVRRHSISKSAHRRLEQVLRDAEAHRDELQAEFDSGRTQIKNRLRT